MTPLPGHLSAPECAAFLLPHRSLPRRGPPGPLGAARGLPLRRCFRYTGRQWKCVPVPTDAQGQPALHATPVDKVWANWAEEGALWQAFVASVRPLAAAQPRERRGRQGDGPHPVAKKGARAWATRATNTSRARRSWPSPTRMATGALPAP
jgi:hypothetical protein